MRTGDSDLLDQSKRLNLKPSTYSYRLFDISAETADVRNEILLYLLDDRF